MCVVGFCKIAACSRIFGQNTKSLIILSTATGENRFVLQWYFGYASRRNLTVQTRPVSTVPGYVVYH